MNGVTTLEHVVMIDAPPAAVYDAWTTAEGLASWWGSCPTIDPRPGGAIVVDVDGAHVMEGSFVELDPPHRVVFTFGWRDGDPAPRTTTVEVRIDAAGTGSRLVLRHDGLPLDAIGSHAHGRSHFVGGRLTEARAAG